MVSMRLAVNLLGITSTIFLARLLTPGDFGVVALAGSAYAFFSVLGQMGFDSALIQHQSPTDEHYNSAWTANILVGLFVSLMMFVVAKPAAWFFEDARIEYVVYAFSLLSAAKGFENIGVVNFRKSLKFKGDFLYFVIPKISGVIVGVTAAYILRNYWALVIGMVTSQVATLLYSHFSQPFRPKFSLTKFHELFGFSRWILLTNGMGYISNNGVEVILGKLMDAASVGILGIARQIANLPSQELLAPINRALFPGFSSVADDPPRLKRIISRVLGVTSMLAIPAAIGIVALAPALVDVVLGEKWREAAPVLAILGIAGVVTAMRSVLGPVLLARGKPKILTLANGAWMVFVIPAVLILVPKFGIVGVAYAGLMGPLITMPILITAVRKDIGFGWLDVGKAAWRPLFASLVMGAAVYYTEAYLYSAGEIGALGLIALILLGVLVFAAALWLTWAACGFPGGAERELWEQVQTRLRNRRGTVS